MCNKYEVIVFLSEKINFDHDLDHWLAYERQSQLTRLRKDWEPCLGPFLQENESAVLSNKRKINWKCEKVLTESKNNVTQFSSDVEYSVCTRSIWHISHFTFHHDYEFEQLKS